MPGETISCHFVLTNILSDDIMTVMNSYWIDSVFTLELILRVIIVGLNNKILDQETQLQYATFESLHSRLLFQY